MQRLVTTMMIVIMMSDDDGADDSDGDDGDGGDDGGGDNGGGHDCGVCLSKVMYFAILVTNCFMLIDDSYLSPVRICRPGPLIVGLMIAWKPRCSNSSDVQTAWVDQLTCATAACLW